MHMNIHSNIININKCKQLTSPLSKLERIIDDIFAQTGTAKH